MTGAWAYRTGPWIRLASVLACLVAWPLSDAGLAYQPPVVQPGGTWAAALRVSNDDRVARRVHLHARLRGHRFWGSLTQAAVRGPWTALDPLELAPGEDRDVPVILGVPAPSAPVLEVEVRGTGTGVRAWGNRGVLPLVDPALVLPGGAVPRERSVPVRVVAGGAASFDEDEVFGQEVHAEAVSTAEEWTALPGRLGIEPPESWGLPRPEGRPWIPAALFASRTGPVLAAETVLLLRSPDHCEHERPLRLWVRSVESQSDGTILCRYSYRQRRVSFGGRPYFGTCDPGSWLLVAIPRTEAPVEFRRVP